MTTKDYHFLLWLYITEAYLEKKGKSLHRRVPAPGILFSASLARLFWVPHIFTEAMTLYNKVLLGFGQKKKKSQNIY